MGLHWKRVNRQGLWETDCVNKRMRGCLVHLGGYDWLIWLILWAGGELNPATQGWAGTVSSSYEKEGSLVMEPYLWEHNREGNLWLGNNWAPLDFPQVSGHTYYLDLTLRLIAKCCKSDFVPFSGHVLGVPDVRMLNYCKHSSWSLD